MYSKLLRAFILRNLGLFAIIIGSMSLSMVGYFVSTNLISNSEQLIAGEIRPILGGDIIIDTGNEFNQDIYSYLQDLEQDQLISLAREAQIFTTLESEDGEFELGNLSFVDSNYPFYREQTINIINPDGEALLNEAAYTIVQNSSNTIELFDQNYQIRGIIEESGSELNVFANGRAQVYLNYERFLESQLSGGNSLIEQNIYVKVLDQANFESILSDIQSSPLFEKVRVQNYQRGGDRFASVISTLTQFISYILTVSFLFSILIIFLSIESFFIGEKKTFSILKILGLSIYKLIGVCLAIFFIIFMLSFVLSYGMSEAIFAAIRSFELSSNFTIAATSIPTGIYIGIMILFVSVLAPLLKFVFHSPLDGLKQNFLQIYSRYEILLQILLLGVGIMSLLYILGGKPITNAIIAGVIIAAGFIVIAVIMLILKLLYKIFSKSLKNKNFILFDAVRNTIKPGNLSGIIVLSFLIIYTSFIFISTLFLSFYERLNLNVDNDKNVFIINVTQENYDLLPPELKTDTYKTLRARVLNINAVSLEDHFTQQGINSRTGRFTREFNITDNELTGVKVLEGVNTLSPGEVSVDQGFAKDLKIGIGDQVEFLVYGLKKTLTIANVRESMEGSVNPFFYFQVQSDDFEKFPKTYFIATQVESKNISQFKKDTIARVGGNISFIEVDAILEQVKSISLKILTLVQVLYGYILVFSIMSIIICIRFFKIFQSRKQKLYYILGTEKKQVQANSFYEYSYLQIVGWLLSVIIASFISYWLLSRSDFIDFNILYYLASLGAASTMFVLVSLFIRYSLQSSN